MRVFVAGASGTIGRRLVPALVRAGHDVTGTSRSARGAQSIEALGAAGIELDALDSIAVETAVAAAAPDVVMHQLTAIGSVDPRDFDGAFAETIALRTRGLDVLLGAAIAAGAHRFIAQSFTGWTNVRSGSAVKDEDDPLDPDPAPSSVRTLAAIAHLEDAVASAHGIDGIVLRYGNLYGPGTGFAPGGDFYRAVLDRGMPVVGGGGGVWSFIHVDDAADATVAAVERGAPGRYNVVDDEPAPVREWLPAFADAIGAKPPRRVPAWVAKWAIGRQGVSLMTDIRGSSNAKAKRELGWQPRHPTWRVGFGVD